MIKDTMNLALEFSNKYDSNIYSLMKDYDCEILFKNMKSKVAYTINIDNINYIVVNENISKNNLDFILAHEFYHTLKHDNTIRQFSKIPLATDRFELEANLFATIFLGCTYKDCKNDNYIQKIINNIYCNYFTCDVIKLM